MEQTKVTQGRIQGITNREEALQVINQACQCRDEDQEWKKKCQELFPDVTTVTTSKKVRDMTNKALMMVDGEAGATQHTNQLSDVTLPLMDKVNILLDDNKSEELEEVKPDNRENQNDHANFKVTKVGGGCFQNFLLFHCLQNQNLLPDAFTMPVSEMVTGDGQGSVNWEMEAQFQIISKHHVPTRDINAKVVNKDKKKYRALH
ncbi:hypothetical protein Pmani_032790 [Petrolisthes manimaculis]|uniref:Uncharacterized protein n=1 Tax=Petrolisthes manimaculis TaxID=1843537 RepID=A0AAE1TRA9_9EUCA|nr:hypothetical protein Pmani_032790 [Petrolisthes manimaculis]